MLFGVATGPVVGCLFDKDMLKRRQSKRTANYVDRLMATFWPCVITLLLAILFQIMAIINRIQAMVSV